MVYAAENSNKFQKTRFWKEKSVEDVVTLGPTAHAAVVIHEKVKKIKNFKVMTYKLTKF